MNCITPEIVKGKRVLVRLDLDVPIKNGKVVGSARLKDSLPTLKILEKAKQVIIIGHRGRPEAEDERYSLEPIRHKLSQMIKQKIVLKKEFTKELPKSKWVMLENLRFDEGEQNNTKKFAWYLSELADIYVNESFATSHRKAASITGVPKYLPSYAGIQLVHEIESIRMVKQHIKHPFILVLGGAKADKLKTLQKLIKQADGVLIGGALMFSLLKAQGVDVGQSKCEESKLAKKLIKQKKILLPVDVALDNKKTVSVFKIPKKSKGLDIGKQTLKHYEDILKNAHTIIWNGSMGYTEKAGFSKGTTELAKIITKTNALTLVGGGDTTSAITPYLSKFTHYSTAGGAFLELLGGKTLPGIKALK